MSTEMKKLHTLSLSLSFFLSTSFCHTQDKKTDNFEPWISMTNQGKLLTKLNPRYVRVVKSLPWLGIELYALKYQSMFIFSSQCYVQKYLVCMSPKSDVEEQTWMIT